MRFRKQRTIAFKDDGTRIDELQGSYTVRFEGSILNLLVQPSRPKPSGAIAERGKSHLTQHTLS